ncbi:MAG: PKD domain-containing protein [Bacteroidetes bacterium]|nr:PKD domain-containing protein [Bacteroidota bacterium]
MKTKTLLNSILKSCLALFIASNVYAQCSLSVIKRDSSSCSLKGFYANTPNAQWEIRNDQGQIIYSSPGTSVMGMSYLPYNFLNNGVFYLVKAASSSAPICYGAYTLAISCASNTCSTTFNATQSSTSCTTYNFSSYSTGSAVEYRLDYGDGNYYFGSSFSNLSHQYSSQGVYTATLSAFTNTHVPLSPCSTYTQAINVSCSPCHASFTYTTDPTNCYTYVTNTSTGSNLTYKWYRSYNGGPIISLGTTTNVVVPMALSNGTNNIGLAIYSNGFYCDSTSQILNINCTPTPTCNASYTYSTDTSCMTHFINMSTGTNLTYSWVEYNNGYTLLSHNINPTLSLSNGQHIIKLYSFSSYALCDSTTQIITINCTPTPTCNSSFTYSTDVNCVTHLINTSSSSNLTFSWTEKIGTNYTLLANTTNPTLYLSNGMHIIQLTVSSNGTYCSSTTQTLNVNCTPTPTCQAAFTSQTDPVTCMTNFINQSIGTNLHSEWIDLDNGYSSLSSSASPTLGLPNGTYHIGLFTFSNGVLCDSVYQYVTINCSGNQTGICQANAQFTVFADSTNPGHYFAYNLSSGTGTLSYLWDFGDGMTSSQQYPFHQYATPGQYPICLLVSANNGSTNCYDVFCDSSSVHRMASGFVMSSINVIPQSVTGIKNVGENLSFKAFPNPIADVLNIEFTNENVSGFVITITDAIGREVLSKEVNGRTSTLNTSYLSKGFYNLILLNDKGEVLKINKLVK